MPSTFFIFVFNTTTTKKPKIVYLIRSVAVCFLFFIFVYYKIQRMESGAQCYMGIKGRYICKYNIRRILTDYNTYANFKVKKKNKLFLFVVIFKWIQTQEIWKECQSHRAIKKRNKMNKKKKTESRFKSHEKEKKKIILFKYIESYFANDA